MRTLQGRWIARLLIVLASLPIWLLIAEFLTRALYPQPTYAGVVGDPYIFAPSSVTPFTLKPGYAGTIIETDHRMTVQINALGYRGNAFTREKPTGVQRILAIGDSFTFGLGVNGDETYAVQLQDRLNAEGSGVYEVINAGYVGGLSPDGCYAYLVHEGLALQPEAIVMGLFMWNDITDLFETAWLETDPSGLPTRVESRARRINARGQLVMKPGMRGAQLVYPPPLSLLADSHLYSLVMRVLYRIRHEIISATHGVLIVGHHRNDIFTPYTIHQPPYPKLLEDKFQTTMRLLDGMRRLSQARGIDFVVMLIPTDVQVHPAMWKKWRSVGVKGPLPPHPDGRDQPQARVMEFCAQQQMQCIDLLPEFRSQASSGLALYLPIDGHWTVDGHRVAADMVARELPRR